MQRVKAKAPEKFKAHVIDTEKRLNILFDHLNNDDVKPDTIQQLTELANNIQARQYDQAGVIFSDIMTNKTDEGSDWIVSADISKRATHLLINKQVGIKRLLQFSKSTPQ
jgi:protein transport protein SEC31